MAKKNKKAFDSDEEDAAVILNVDEEGEDLGGLMATLQSIKSKGKKKKNVKTIILIYQKQEEVDINISKLVPEVGEVHLKTKAEKEREKKERLKQEKLKKKKTEIIEKPSEVKVESVVEEQDDIHLAKKDDKKNKKEGAKPSKAVLALRAQMAAQKEEEEKEIHRIAEEEAKEAAILAAAEEEVRLNESRKLERKEKERIKKELLKKEGKYMTPAQKQAANVAKLKLQAMLDSGIIKVAALDEDVGISKKPVYGKKKKPTAKALASIPPAMTETVSVIVKDIPALKDSVPDEWDASDDDKIQKANSLEVEQNVLEAKEQSDDAPSDWEGGDSDTEGKVEIKATKKENIAPPKATKPKGKIITTPASTGLQSNKASNSKKPVNTDKSSKVEKEEEEIEESGSEEDSEDEESDEELTTAEKMALQRKHDAAKRREERIAQAWAARSKDNLRSPICCILGHVDTGKTKLLDKIRQTNVQEGEAGGITQQIGATFFPIEAIITKTEMMREVGEHHPYNLPGMLMIDTPGHESFTNLRSRGSSLCNMAVLVVDIVHGLEPQTIESLNMLRDRKTPFIVALNKIDRLFDWKANANYPTRKTLALQKKHVLKEFEERVTKTIVAFAEQGLNACLYWDNKNLGRTVSLVPTSAITGEGIPDLLHLLMDLTQTRMTERLMYLSELECTVLEVKVIEGLGTTIDVVLSNGFLNEGDRICVCGLNGPIVTTIRALLTPQPMRELRIKSAYVHHKQVKASLGVKIAAPDLEKAVAGARLMVIGPDDDESDIRETVMGDLVNLLTSIDKSGKGVCVQASTLGSLEALLSFLKVSNIPVSGINIGPGNALIINHI
jgi:translation initiation factor 5B